MLYNIDTIFVVNKVFSHKQLCLGLRMVGHQWQAVGHGLAWNSHYGFMTWLYLWAFHVYFFMLMLFLYCSDFSLCLKFQLPLPHHLWHLCILVHQLLLWLLWLLPLHWTYLNSGWQNVLPPPPLILMDTMTCLSVFVPSSSDGSARQHATKAYAMHAPQVSSSLTESSLPLLFNFGVLVLFSTFRFQCIHCLHRWGIPVEGMCASCYCFMVHARSALSSCFSCFESGGIMLLRQLLPRPSISS